MTFANKYIFLLLALVVVYIIWYIRKHNNIEPSVRVSDTSPYAAVGKTWREWLVHVPFVLRVVALTMIVIVLARPQSSDNWQNTEIEGIDIMMTIDVSTSMLSEDLKPNRLEAAKDVAA